VIYSNVRLRYISGQLIPAGSTKQLRIHFTGYFVLKVTKWLGKIWPPFQKQENHLCSNSPRAEKGDCSAYLSQVDTEKQRGFPFQQSVTRSKEIKHDQHQDKIWSLISCWILLKPDDIHFWQTNHMTLHKVSFYNNLCALVLDSCT